MFPDGLYIIHLTSRFAPTVSKRMSTFADPFTVIRINAANASGERIWSQVTIAIESS